MAYTGIDYLSLIAAAGQDAVGGQLRLSNITGEKAGHDHHAAPARQEDGQ